MNEIIADKIIADNLINTFLKFQKETLSLLNLKGKKILSSKTIVAPVLPAARDGEKSCTTQNTILRAAYPHPGENE